MMYPMTRVRNFDQAMVFDNLRSPVRFGIGGPTLHPPEQQRGTGDLAQDLPRVINVGPVWREASRKVVELPDQRSVRIPVRAMERQMAGDLVREVWVGFFHSRDRRFKIGVTTRLSLLDVADMFNPFTHPLGRRAVNAVRRRRP